jgi:hypothetical protein
VKRTTLARLSLFLAVALGGAGCVVIPHKPTRVSGVVVPDSAAAGLSAGEVTREEVLHRLGRPERVEENGRFFFYQWTTSSVGWLLVAASPAAPGAGGMAGGDIPTAKWFLCMEFSPKGKLVRCERVRGAVNKADDTTLGPWMRQTTPGVHEGKP